MPYPFKMPQRQDYGQLKTSKPTLIAMLTALAFANSANAQGMQFDKVQDTAVTQHIAQQQRIEASLKKAGIAPEVRSMLMRSLNSASALKNGDEYNEEIDCHFFAVGRLDKFNSSAGEYECYDVPLTDTDNVVDVLMYYTPRWLKLQPSTGEAYKWVKKEIDNANKIFAANTSIQFRMVGFEIPDLSGYRDFYVREYGGEERYQKLVSYGFPDYKNTFDLNIHPNNEVDNYPGIDRLMHLASFDMIGAIYNNEFTLESMPPVAAQMYHYGSDIMGLVREIEADIAPHETGVCGYAGGGSFILIQDSVSQIRCEYVTAHEIGHLFHAGHEPQPTDPAKPMWRRARAAECAGRKTAMAAVGGNLHPVLSGPNTVVNNETCGNEETANNVKQVELSAPFVQNVGSKMQVVGSVWIDSQAITANESDSSIEIKVTRNGDLSVPTSVDMFIDSGTALLSSDFLKVKFDADQASATVKLNVVNNDSTQENKALTAELVMPFKMDLDADKKAVTITIKNDDAAPVLPPPPVTPPTDSGSSGGSLGFGILSLLGLVFARKRFR
ncbi:MAG: hypothetical protein ACRCT7_17105 [Shewanella sp.]